MDNKLLKVFVHLSETLHFAHTAKAHHVSPSTLSRMIQRVEDDVGATLLVRDNRSVMLTAAGERFRDFAKQQLANWQQLNIELATDQKQLSGRLSIYCSVTAAYSHLPSLLDRFRRQHPAVEIMLHTGNANDAIDKVLTGDVDLSIAAQPDNHSRAVYFQPFAHIPLTLIAPTVACQVQDQLARHLDWQQLPVIMPDHGPARQRFEHFLKAHGVHKANVYATVSGHEALVSMVALGCGVGIAPQVVIDNSPVIDRVKALSSGPQIEPFVLGLCCQNKRRVDPLIGAFYRTLDATSVSTADRSSPYFKD
ncbi:HTH-type transcriptional activator IlvY [Thalassotalea ponticola]|uniref:HTH-type transcriptional activator IlvY n=1 Tax=Thalassotalea ponticola TaxID=1523392 RepID=UPI0025B4A355|nr:HTH-type transcriptional activator IlvY [Thalassotalea ponticola]MDN3652476.1 HTH-type transcriptional activator IlvY [Thalassotalea ponticola]